MIYHHGMAKHGITVSNALPCTAPNDLRRPRVGSARRAASSMQRIDQRRPNCSRIDIPHRSHSRQKTACRAPLPRDRGSQRQRSGQRLCDSEGTIGLFRHNMPARLAGCGIKIFLVISCRPRVVDSMHGLCFIRSYTFCARI